VGLDQGDIFSANNFLFEKVVHQMVISNNKGEKDRSKLIRSLDPKQRKSLKLFREYDIVTSKKIGDLCGFQPRTNSALCKNELKVSF